MIQRYYDILPKADHENIYYSLIRSRKWFPGGLSDPAEDVVVLPEDPILPIFWCHKLEDEPYITDNVFTQIKKFIGSEYVIDSVYANGQTRGQDGNWHVDNAVPDTGPTHTFLYYCNPLWKPEWGGQTLFKDSPENPITYIPNSGILFESNRQHLGLGPNVTYYGLRITIAFKLYKEEK